MRRRLTSDFPLFCASFIGSYSLLQAILLSTLKKLACPFSRGILITRLLAGFLASFFTLPLLNRQGTNPSTGRKSSVRATLDLTLLVAIRATETLIGSRYRSQSKPWCSIPRFLGTMADPFVFIISSGIVMWNFFYYPEKLPSAYQKWIKEAAHVDSRLIDVLRNCRRGVFVYGKDTGQASILQSMCADYGWPLEWGDPALTVPVPCEVVHMRAGSSCHLHGLSRCVRAFKYAFAMYLPAQLLIKLRRPSTKSFSRALREAIRSSTFLSTFIGSFYYSICLTRTLIGPKLAPGRPQLWDSGLCIAAAWFEFFESDLELHTDL